MLYGGLRASETLSITLDNISVARNNLYKISFKGKGDKERITYIKCDYIYEEIEIFKDEYMIGSNIIAITQSGKVMCRHSLARMVNSIYKKLGIKASGVHVLRHTAAKSLVNAGVSIVVVQSILGHSSLNTTAIYANPTQQILEDALDV